MCLCSLGEKWISVEGGGNQLELISVYACCSIRVSSMAGGDIVLDVDLVACIASSLPRYIGMEM